MKKQSMLIIPAIDLKDRLCVRLRQGRMDDSTIFSDDPVAVAGGWYEKGARRLHIVDLNGAFAGERVNAEIVSRITTAYPDFPIQIGGGIRNMESIDFYLNVGVSYVIIGTAAITNPDFVKEACLNFPGKIIVGIDAKDGMVATNGWVDVSDVTAVSLAETFSDSGAAAIVYTDISRDGMMQGSNLIATQNLAQRSPIPIIASGGISNLADVVAVKEISDTCTGGSVLGLITGRAIYEDRLDLTAAQAMCDA
jgi:phosphoribosylformimino-5-aminoimidazole carboxamide ribotide isomerase